MAVIRETAASEPQAEARHEHRGKSQQEKPIQPTAAPLSTESRDPMR